MCNTCYHRPKLLNPFHHGSHYEGNKEQGEQHGGVEDHGSDGDNRDADERTGIGLAEIGGEGLHIHVGDDEDSGQADGPDDLSENEIAPAGTGSIS